MKEFGIAKNKEDVDFPIANGDKIRIKAIYPIIHLESRFSEKTQK